MANLQFLRNVTHGGRLLLGPVVKDNIEQAPGMIVDLGSDLTGLSGVAQDLCDRKLARYTNDAATHTTTMVGPDGVTALAIDAAPGAGRAPAIKSTAVPQPDGFPQKAAPQAQAPQAPAQQQQAKQPTAAEVAAAAAAA